MAKPNIKILRPDDYREMTWKNGKGVTVEIAISPEAATVDDFDWRVSMATVSEDGPFSSFPGIDRTLSVLDGKGLELTVEGEAPARLTVETAPHGFAADKPTQARLIGGKLTDFNVMTRRGKCTHSVEMITASARVVNRKDWTILVAYCHTGTANIDADGNSALLEKGQTMIVDSSQSATLAFALTRGARIYLARISFP